MANISALSAPLGLPNSFAATIKFIAARRHLVERFVRGYAKELQWLAANDAGSRGCFDQ